MTGKHTKEEPRFKAEMLHNRLTYIRVHVTPR
jgi:hypothetical protein